MATIGMREMLEAGAHFGHQTRRWNPKMKRYIFGARNGVYIIDLQQTVGLFETAYQEIVKTIGKGGKVLFIGTKKQAADVIAEEAGRSGQYWVNNRWLGGMLTNFNTIKKSIDRMKNIEKMSTDGTFDRLPKKEVIKLTRELAKLEKNLSGIRDMSKLPSLVFVIDPQKEHIAVQEARRLGVKIVGIVDTNCDPDLVDFVIPANDDAIRSIRLFASKIADACAEGGQMNQERLATRSANEKKAKEKTGGGVTPQKGGTGPQVDVIRPKAAAAAATPAEPEPAVPVEAIEAEKAEAPAENTETSAAL